MPSSFFPAPSPRPAPTGRRGRRSALLAGVAAALAALPAAAQDLEMLSAESGVPLPAEYYERVRNDPRAFDTRYEWKQRNARASAVEGASVVTTGHLRMVVMPVLFADSNEPPVGAGAMQQQLFGLNPLGNLTAYYREVSGGRLTVTGTVLPWVRTSFTLGRVAGRVYGFGIDANLPWHFREAVAQLDASVNFGQFDNDGPDDVPNSGDDDGRVDLAVFRMAEQTAECGNPSSLWPHRASLWQLMGAPYATNDLTPAGKAILLDDYHIESVLDCDGAPASISNIAHETGHALGLPDLFDAAGTLFTPAERRWILGCWTLMAGGALGCGDGKVFGRGETPPHMGPWEKMQLGWDAPVTVEPGWRREYRLEPVQLSGQMLRIPLFGAQEYLLLEYRTRTGFDRGIPSSGVLVYHVDTSRPFARGCNPCRPTYHVQMIEADGDSALVRRPLDGGNRGVAGDAFTGRRFLSDFTHPSLRPHNGTRANYHVEIDVAAGFARVIVSTPPVVATAPLVAPLIGSAGAGPTADERAGLDLFGNRNGGYDMGDLRAYMRIHPGTVQGS